jgi:hypothetical protein
MTRPTKRTRSDARGRTEALVLNGREQLVAAEARLSLRQNKKDMKAKIREAKKAEKMAVSTLSNLCKELHKAATEVEKQHQNSIVFAAKALESADKKHAASASTQAQKAAEKSKNICETIASKLHAISEAMHAALQRKAVLFQVEEDLKKLEDAAQNVQEEMDEEEEDEDEEEEGRERPAADAVASMYEDAQTESKNANESAKSTQDYADKAALYALLAVAKHAWKQAISMPTRGRSTSSRGRGRGRGHIAIAELRGTTAENPPSIPIASIP